MRVPNSEETCSPARVSELLTSPSELLRLLWHQPHQCRCCTGSDSEETCSPVQVSELLTSPSKLLLSLLHHPHQFRCCLGSTLGETCFPEKVSELLTTFRASAIALAPSALIPL